MNQDRKPKPEKLRTDIYRLALDWVHLNRELPQPAANPDSRRPKHREYGHLAEWASDRKKEISDMLASWHEYLATERNETPPPATAAEQVRVTKAWQYLETRCQQLIELVEPEALKEIPDLHHTIRRTLGYTKPRYTLPIPCPSTDCGLRTLIRTAAVGQDFITCESCGYTIKETHYPLLIRMTFDTLLNQ
jgi:hypothetical protein